MTHKFTSRIYFYPLKKANLHIPAASQIPPFITLRNPQVSKTPHSLPCGICRCPNHPIHYPAESAGVQIIPFITLRNPQVSKTPHSLPCGFRRYLKCPIHYPAESAGSPKMPFTTLRGLLFVFHHQQVTIIT